MHGLDLCQMSLGKEDCASGSPDRPFSGVLSVSADFTSGSWIVGRLNEPRIGSGGFRVWGLGLGNGYERGGAGRVDVT